MSTWSAPRASGPVSAQVAVPASKSLTARALLLATLADEPSRLIHPLNARDSDLMTGALRAIGASIWSEGADLIVTPPHLGTDLLVTPPRLGAADRSTATTRPDVTVDCGLAGTVMRFVPPIAALTTSTVHFDGDPGARVRPMRALLEALRDLGVSVDDAGTGGLPFTIEGAGQIAGGRVAMDASASSQFVSALLLAGCRFTHGLVIDHVGAVVPSLPHIEMTLAELRARGVQASRVGPTSWQVLPGAPRGGDITLEPDLSNAAPFLAAALVTGGCVRVADWPKHTSQPGDLLPELLTTMGATVTRDGDALVVSGSGVISGLGEVDLSAASELTPVLAALAALAETPSQFLGIGHIRGHETDRLAALVTEINRLGGDAEETADGLIVRPRPLHGGLVQTYHDHRIAQAGAVLGLAVDDLLVENIETTGKTMPTFVSLWNAMLVAA